MFEYRETIIIIKLTFRICFFLNKCTLLISIELLIAKRIESNKPINYPYNVVQCILCFDVNIKCRERLF